MVRCNLTILLAERNLKITKVANDTGLSRTTLTYLSNNYSKGIQYDTLNTLCTYLGVTPGQLISHIPYDIDIDYVHITGDDYTQLDLKVDITNKGETKIFSLEGKTKISLCDGVLTGVEIDLYLPDPDGNPEIEFSNSYIQNMFSSLPLPFLKDIESNISGDIINELSVIFNCEYDETPVNLSFYWNDVISKPPTT